MSASKERRAGGDFAEEIVGHWQLWAHPVPTQAEVEALKDKIRHFCIPKSRVRAEITKLMQIPDEDWEDVQSESLALLNRLLRKESESK